MNLWRFSVESLRDKNSRGDTVLEANPTFLWVLLLASLINYYSDYQRKIPLYFQQRESFLNTPEHAVLNEACLQVKWFNQSLTCWGFTRAYLPEVKYPPPATCCLPCGRRKISNSRLTLAIMPYINEGKLRAEKHMWSP